MIPYGQQHITDDDIDAVVSVLRSELITQGPKIPEFEAQIKDYCGVTHAVAVNSATSALHLACLALGLGPGDWLWTTPVTFVASANCALYCGASVDFVDIDPLTCNLSVVMLKDKLRSARTSGMLPKVVVPVHLAGHPCDMAEIHALSEEYGFSVLEDASHALGAKIYNEPVGNCRFSEITVFSFHPVKIITTAEGGAATTNSNDLAEKMMRLRTHGITRDPLQMALKSEGPWYYEQLDLGFNYRMNDIQAALGTEQMRRLDTYIVQRQQIAELYKNAFSDLPVTLPVEQHDRQSSFHLYIIRLQPCISRKHLAIFQQLRTLGVGVNLHYIPIPRQPYYRRLGHRSELFPQAEQYYSQAISLPMFPTMTDAQLSHVISAVRKVFTEAQQA